MKRKVLCKQYDECLDDAIVHGWKNFHCNEFKDYRILDWSDEEWADDARTCGELLNAIFCPYWDQADLFIFKADGPSSIDLEALQADELLKPSQVSGILGMLLNEVVDLCKGGRLEYVQLGKLIRTKTGSILEFAQHNLS